MKKLKLVIDTNILLVIIGRQSKHNWLFEAYLNKKFELLVSTPILLEYFEKITERTNSKIAEDILSVIINSTNVLRVEPTFRMNLIPNDTDDNAFVDCAFSGGADYLITNDKHFDILKTIEFPIIPIIRLETFYELFLESKLWN